MDNLAAISGATSLRTITSSSATSNSAASKTAAAADTSSTAIVDVVTISPEARAAKAGGQPLFAVEGATRVPGGGTTDVPTSDKKKVDGPGRSEEAAKAQTTRGKMQMGSHIERTLKHDSTLSDRIDNRVKTEANEKSQQQAKTVDRTGRQEQDVKARTRDRMGQMEEQEKAGIPVSPTLSDGLLNRMVIEKTHKGGQVDRFDTQESANKARGADASTRLSDRTSAQIEQASEVGELRIGRSEQRAKQKAAEPTKA